MDKYYEDSEVLRHYGNGAFDSFSINPVFYDLVEEAGVPHYVGGSE